MSSGTVDSVLCGTVWRAPGIGYVRLCSEGGESWIEESKQMGGPWTRNGLAREVLDVVLARHAPVRRELEGRVEK